MRIDRFMTENGLCSRKDAKKYAKNGDILINGVPIKDVSKHIDETKDIVTFLGEEICYSRFVYIMLNKPEGYVSATQDNLNQCVLGLLDDRLQKIGLFPVGRLDKDTTGLMILTNNGPLAHYLLSPKRHVEKEYYFTLSTPLKSDAEEKIKSGLEVDKGLICKSATLKMNSDRLSGTIILTEGKYHEIKRMMLTLGSEIVTLKRISFASIILDKQLSVGDYRYLTKDEENSLLELMPNS